MATLTPPRFERNGIVELMEIDRPFNLSESTSQDLDLGDVLTPEEIAGLAGVTLGYGTLEGLPELRAELAGERGIDPDCVLTTQGAVLALFLSAMELCRGGDNVVVLRPTFPATMDTLRAAGGAIREVPLRFADGYRLGVERVLDAVDGRTRLVTLASPQNPSGVAFSRDELEALATALHRAAPDAWLLVDETYREASVSGAIEPSVADLATRGLPVMTCGSISKAYGTPGLRLGWMTVPDADLYERLRIAKMNTVITESVLCETLALRVLERREPILARQRDVLSAGLATIERWLPTVEGLLSWVRPDAGALCCMRLDPDAINDDAVRRFYDRQAEFDLQVSRGAWFGDESRVLRVGFGHPKPEVLRPALDALASLARSVASS
ncbi:MAG: pyridoxal phosphate-dependent aminotransferase [Planctomycetota bacterium]